MTQITVTLKDHAYAAGFVEADGCIHIGFTVSVRVVNRNLEVLRWFEERYGGQVRSKVKPEGCWEWNVHSDAALGFLTLISEYLVFKGPQVDLLFEYAKTRQPRGKKVDEGKIKAREGIKARMKEEKAKWRS